MECNECKSKNVRINGYESYCLDCGLVEDYFEQQTSATQLSNTIGTHKAGRIVKASSLLTWKEKNVAKATWLLKLIESKLMLPNIVVQDALYIYRALLEKNLIRGRSIEALICACVYIAAKRNKHKLSFDDFKKYNNVRRLKQAYKCIIKNSDVRIEYDKIEDILNYVFFKIKFPAKRRDYTLGILKKIKDKGLIAGKKPESVLAGLLYFVSIKYNLLITQQKICGALDNRSKTLRKYYKVVQNVQRDTKIK